MEKVHVIDLGFQGIEQTIAAFLIETEDGPVLIETGPHSSIDRLYKGIGELGYRADDIQVVLLSHIHLDHAGAAWAFAERGARIYVHPRGLPHLNQPEKLMASARRIYRDQMDVLWGEMHPIPKAQLFPVEHLAHLMVGDRQFTALHTPGHAVHHIAWQLGGIIFTGDVGGVRIGTGPVVPPCPPPDIDLEAWRNSIKLLLHRKPAQLALTHFGFVDQVDQHLRNLQNMLESWSAWIKPFAMENRDKTEVIPQFQAFVQQQLKEMGVKKAGLQQYETANPSWMSVAGLYRYWQKKG